MTPGKTAVVLNGFIHDFAAGAAMVLQHKKEYYIDEQEVPKHRVSGIAPSSGHSDCPYCMPQGRSCSRRSMISPTEVVAIACEVLRGGQSAAPGA